SAPLTRAELGLRENAKVICLASRAIEQKGWREAVEMTRRMNAAGHATDLMLIGEGPEADALGGRAPPFVHLYGQVANLQDYIAAADIGILPTRFVGESMPLVLIEMMAKGTPVVATDVGAIPVMIGTDADAAGIVVPLVEGKADVAGFVDALSRLLDKDRRIAFGKAARKRFEERYSIDTMIDVYGDAYRRVQAETRGDQPDATGD
ncbi:MAG: glycosyltransferase family 4 protein, partial [Mesorhizobium sp.]|nr:glycosyltransferase family 4 protein [Mesorhizobium sp.]